MYKNLKSIFDKISEIPGANTDIVEDGISIVLPPALESDYNFSVFLHENVDPNIAASYSNDKAAYFWYYPFKLDDFYTEEELSKEFYDTVVKLFTSHTKIVQIKGILNWSFKCYYKENDSWLNIYSHMALRWINAPKITEKSVTYNSNEIVSEL